MTFIEQALAIVGDAQVLTGADAEPYATDWTGKYASAPLCVVRPASTADVAALMTAAQESRTPVVPIAGNTGLAGGTWAEGAALLSLERMRAIRAIREEARVAVVEAGVVLEDLHEAARAADLAFPLTFGARGSAMIGGLLSTNAGGSNVLRYGNARALCLGLEVVLPDGRVMDLMSELHKDNSGYDLKDLFIGAEGTLGVITAATLKLASRPRAFATAMLAVPSLTDALGLLNRLQAATGGAVEAFEYMPQAHFERLAELHPETRMPFEAPHDVNILLEIGATAPRDTTPNPDGSLPITSELEEILADEMDQGHLLEAVIAQTEAQRAEMWARREAAAEIAFSRRPFVANDIALPLDKLEAFFERMADTLPDLDPEADDISVAHLGDGNIHYTVYPSTDDPAHLDAVMQLVETQVRDLGGSFSAEHGIGLSKKPSMSRHKDPVALDVMRRIKAALDPAGIMNPGKVLPD